MKERNVQGALTFIGFAISVLAILYFAIEYIPYLSPWSRVAALVALGVAFGAFASYIRSTTVGGPFFDSPRLQWLKPSNVFILLAIFAAIMADVAFFAVPGVETPVKVLVSLLAGILLVVVAARVRQRAPDAAP